MGVYTPAAKSPDQYLFDENDHHRMVMTRPDDRLEIRSDLDLEAVLMSLAPLPPYSALVGICEDGLPLLLDLKNPASGSILIIGKRVEVNRPLLRSLLASAVLLNTVEEVQLYLISAAGSDFSEFQEVPGSLEILNPQAPAVLELLRRLACRVQRQPCGRRARGVEVLLIENLADLIVELDSRGCRALDWLVEFGPQAGVWVIAGLDAAQFKETQRVRVEAFPTQLIDAVDRKLLKEVAGLAIEGGLGLHPGAQYCARRAGEVIPFWLPRYTYLPQPEKRVVKGTTK